MRIFGPPGLSNVAIADHPLPADRAGAGRSHAHRSSPSRRADLKLTPTRSPEQVSSPRSGYRVSQPKAALPAFESPQWPDVGRRR
jgi:hypothetical protein